MIILKHAKMKRILFGSEKRDDNAYIFLIKQRGKKERKYSKTISQYQSNTFDSFSHASTQNQITASNFCV